MTLPPDAPPYVPGIRPGPVSGSPRSYAASAPAATDSPMRDYRSTTPDTLGGYAENMDTHSDHSNSPTGSLVQDPVCGMDVDPATSEHHLERDGHDHYFCSAGCRAKFEAQPEAYLTAPAGHPSSGHAHGAHDHAREPRENWRRRSGGRRRRRRGGGVDVPDAPGDPPAGPGHLPHLRHGTRAGHRDRRTAAPTRSWPT